MLTATKLRYDNFIAAFAANKWQRADLAAIDAGFAESCAKQTAHRLITTDYCRKAIAQIQADLAVKSAYTQEVGLNKLLHAYDVAEQQKQPAAMVSAVIGANRMHGYDKDANIGEKTIIIISPKRPKVIDNKEVKDEVPE